MSRDRLLVQGSGMPVTPYTITLTNGQPLTITSGAVGVTSGTLNLGAMNTGTLAFGNNPGYFTGRSGITVGAAITGTNGIVVGGPVTVSLNGTNTYTGDTIVYGQLKTINGADRIPDASNIYVGVDGLLTVGDGIRRDEVAGSLSGRGVMIWGSNTTKSSLRLGVGLTQTIGAVTVGTYIAPGDPTGSMQAGTLTLGSATIGVDVIFQPGSALRIDLASATQSDVLAMVNGSATLNGGDINITLLGGYTPQAGDTFKVLTTTGGVTGAFGNVTASGYTFSQQIVDGGKTLQLSVIPEPASISLAGSLGTLLLLGRRRSRSR